MKDRTAISAKMRSLWLLLGACALSATAHGDDHFPAAGNSLGGCAVPPSAAAEDASRPGTVIGDGTAASCTGDAVVQGVAKGGIIAFDCGPDPVTIVLTRPAKIVNNTGPKIVIDGGGKVTLSGGGTTRILYMNTCDAGAGVDHLPLPGSGSSAAHRAKPRLHRR